MTDKKRRQRGSRTHGGGSHKNRRGAGNRGGRGDAGRDKHEMHNYPDREKHGFTRPPDAQDTVHEVPVQKLDEDAALYAAEGLAEEDDGGYRIDVREVADASADVDVVKVLGGGQVRQQLHVVADDFTDGAADLIESAGGTAELSERGEKRREEMEAAEDEDDGAEEEQ